MIKRLTSLQGLPALIVLLVFSSIVAIPILFFTGAFNSPSPTLTQLPTIMPSPTIEPTPTWKQRIQSIEWINTVDSYSVTKVDEGGSQAIVGVTLTDTSYNNMENITSIYAYVLEDLMQFDVPFPVYISIVAVDDTQKIVYEQLGEDTQLTAKVLDNE